MLTTIRTLIRRARSRRQPPAPRPLPVLRWSEVLPTDYVAASGVVWAVCADEPIDFDYDGTPIFERTRVGILAPADRR